MDTDPRLPEETRRSISRWRHAAMVCLAFAVLQLPSCRIVPAGSLGLTLGEGGAPELWFAQCGVFVDYVELRPLADPNHRLWRIAAVGTAKNLRFRTVIGSIPPGFTSDVPLTGPLQRGTEYELAVGGGEAFYEETTFRLEDLHPGEIRDFAGGVRPAKRFVIDTRCD